METLSLLLSFVDELPLLSEYCVTSFVDELGVLDDELEPLPAAAGVEEGDLFSCFAGVDDAWSDWSRSRK